MGAQALKSFPLCDFPLYSVYGVWMHRHRTNSSHIGRLCFLLITHYFLCPSVGTSRVIYLLLATSVQFTPSNCSGGNEGGGVSETKRCRERRYEHLSHDLPAIHRSPSPSRHCSSSNSQYTASLVHLPSDWSDQMCVQEASEDVDKHLAL